MTELLTPRTTAPSSLPRLAPPPAIDVAVAVLEALIGRRALHQVRPHVTERAFLQLVRCVDTGRLLHTQVARLRVQRPAPDALEVCTRLRVGRRWLACVIRLDRTGRWGCTELQVLGLA